MHISTELASFVEQHLHVIHEPSIFLAKQNGPQQSERNKNINQRLPPQKEMDRHGVFFVPGKQPLLLISINFTLKTSLPGALKKCTFLGFPGRIFTRKYPTVNSGNSNSKVDQMQVGICLIKTNIRYTGLFENRAQYCNCNCNCM